MAEDEDEEPIEPIKDEGQVAPGGLYEVVKMQLFSLYMRASNDLAEVHRREAHLIAWGPSYMSNRGPRFVSTVIALYVLIHPKLDYITDYDFSKLREIDDYLSEKKDVDKMPFSDAIQYFMLEGIFLEKIGITKFERAKKTPEEQAFEESL